MGRWVEPWIPLQIFEFIKLDCSRREDNLSSISLPYQNNAGLKSETTKIFQSTTQKGSLLIDTLNCAAVGSAI